MLLEELVSHTLYYAHASTNGEVAEMGRVKNKGVYVGVLLKGFLH